MTDWDRLSDYIENYFPEPIYNTKDVSEWAQKSVPAWKHMDSKTQKTILGDWENFIQPKVEGRLRGFSQKFLGRIKRFLGRLF